MTRYANVGGVAVELDGGGGGGGAPVPGLALPDSFIRSASSAPTVTFLGSATPFSPGSWLLMDAALTAAAGGVTMLCTSGSFVAATDSSTLVQIGLGAGGAEVPWATVPVGYLTIGQGLTIPGGMPAGSRVACRVLSSVQASKSVQFAYAFLPDTGLAAPVTYATTPATAKGAVLTYSGTVNVSSGWTVITASTSAPIDVLTVLSQGGGDTAMAGGGVLLDIGVGAPGAEVVVATVSYALNASEYIAATSPTAMAVPTIPAGSRLCASFQTNTALQNTWDVAVIGAALA